MSWSDSYWDILNELYWVPSYLGLKSIPQRHWTIEADKVAIPKALTNPSGPLYRRVRSGDGYEGFVRRQEETFNHIFNLTLSILPGDVITEIFGPFAGFDEAGDLQVLGKSVSDRYAWIAGANATTPDALLLSEMSVLAIEIKFNAKTSLDQLAKYVALIAGEEIHGGKRERLDLLFVFPADAEENFLRQTKIYPSELGVQHFELLSDTVKNARVKNLYRTESDAVKDTLSRLNITCITWQQLHDRVISFVAELGSGQGDKTLFRLLTGFASEVAVHPLSNVESRGQSESV